MGGSVELGEPDERVCQSCGMPMRRDEDFGTEADGSLSEDYCGYCYQNGEFTNPDITMQEMIDKVVSVMVFMQQMPRGVATVMVENHIPKLKRWRE